MNPTAPRICSGVPDCPSGLWIPGSSGLRVWSCPPALLEADQKLASQSSGDLRPRAAVGAGQREPLDTGGVVLCRTARGCGRLLSAARSLRSHGQGPAAPRSSHLHLCLFFLSHPQPELFALTPPGRWGGRGAGREEGRAWLSSIRPPSSPSLSSRLHSGPALSSLPSFFFSFSHHDLWYQPNF